MFKTMERFRKKVLVDPETGCHVWQGAKIRGGYGHFRDYDKMVPAHRFHWEVIHGKVPDDLKVCHSCANPACVNPAHLYLDTHARNMAKMSEAGRIARGGKHGQSKLKEEQVREIIDLFRTGKYAKSEIARRFGVTRETVSKVVSGKRWRHVTN